MKHSQQIELNPNNKQATLMSEHAGYARVAYNFGLSSFRRGLEVDEWRTYIDIKREFNAVKYDAFDWCKDLSQNASKNAIHNLGDAVTRWKKGQNSFPTYKKRSDRISYQADNGVGTVEIYKKRIKLPKIGWVRMHEELRYRGEIRKVVVSIVKFRINKTLCVGSVRKPNLPGDESVSLFLEITINATDAGLFLSSCGAIATPTNTNPCSLTINTR